MAADAARVTIGAVLARLRPEFPGITVSKIRFLEEQGLVVPERTPSGYRTFSDADVDRLRHVLRAQRDRFLPLKVIRAELEAGHGPAASHDPAAGSEPDADRSTRAAPEPTVDLPPSVDTEELCRLSAIDREVFRELVTFGLLVRGEDGRFGPDDVGVARAAGALVRRGVEVRHLRPFRAAAEREIELVEHVVGLDRMRRRGTEDDAGATSAAGALADAGALHAALVARAARAGGLR